MIMPINTIWTPPLRGAGELRDEYVSRIMRLLEELPMETLAALCRLYGVGVDELADTLAKHEKTLWK
jgi:hypothetical protein